MLRAGTTTTEVIILGVKQKAGPKEPLRQTNAQFADQVKSGYGLDWDTELKMLQTINEALPQHRLEGPITFLVHAGNHTIGH